MIRHQEMKNFILSLLNILLYFLSIFLSFTISYFLFAPITNIFNLEINIFAYNDFAKQLLIVIVLCGSLFLESGVFTDKRLNLIDKFLIIFKEMFLGTIILLIIQYVYPQFLISPFFIIFSWIVSVLFIYLSAVLVYYIRIFYRKHNFSNNHVLLIGNNRISQIIQQKNRENYRGRTYFYPYKTINFTELKKYILRKKITEVIICQYQFSREELLEFSNVCESAHAVAKFSPSMLELRLGELTSDNDLGIPILQIKPVSFLDKNFINKRLFDVFFSILILALSMFPMLFICLLIKLTSRGPIFFQQKRVGLQGRIFNFFKFRSMIVDAEKLLDKLKDLNERQGPVFKIKKDPRITFIGKFLRKTSLDEFPQFYNVLKGDMSIVGPRPPIPCEVESFCEDAMRRFKVFPGITGIWQISGRSDLSFDQMINLDIYYLEHWTLALDIKILLKTIPAVLISKGAC